MYLLTHPSEGNMRFILRVIFFSKLFARARSASANNWKKNDEQNKSHIARKGCVNRFIARPPPPTPCQGEEMNHGAVQENHRQQH